MEACHIPFWASPILDIPIMEIAKSAYFHFRQVSTYSFCEHFSTVTPTYYICFGARKIQWIQWWICFCIWASPGTCHFTSCCCFVFFLWSNSNMLWGSFAHDHALHHAYFMLELISCHDIPCGEVIKLVNMLSWICFCHATKFYHVWVSSYHLPCLHWCNHHFRRSLEHV